MRSLKNILLFPLIAVFLSGCNSIAPKIESELSTSSSFSSYPVKLDESKQIDVHFEHKSDNKKNEDLKYTRIMFEAPISKGKVMEGDASTNDFQLKQYMPKNGEEFTATTTDSSYQAPIRLLRKNFRMINIVLNDKSIPAEVLFLQVKNPTQVSNNMEFFDVFVESSRAGLLDTKENRNWNEDLTLAETLSDCGELSISDDPNELAEEISLGGNSEDKAAEKAKKYPPDELGPIESTDIPQIKKINPGKESAIDKYFSASRTNNPFLTNFRRIGSEAAQQHPGGFEIIKLTSASLKVKKGEYLESAKNISMIVSQSPSGEEGSPVIEIDFNGKRYLYAPVENSTFSPAPSTSLETSGLGISSVEPNTQAAETDPWCGFTPESKPAIYLYPEKTGIVRIKLDPQNGWISLSKPTYSKEGWTVLANPSGYIYANGSYYPHLFYEAMLKAPVLSDKIVLIKQESLWDDLYDLSKNLSLTDRESKELADYWVQKLPKTKYFKVGLMDRAEIDAIEPIQITPQPDSFYRIRLIFEPTNQEFEATDSFKTTFARSGFTAIEWGGFVLNSKD